MTFHTVFLFALALSVVPLGAETPLGQATISYIQNDVSVADINLLQVQNGQVAKTPAKLRQPVTKDQVVVTGGKSRAELTFADGTVARVGQHSVFSFASTSRKMEIQTGSALFHVPKNRGTTEIKSGPVTASIVGTTLMIQVINGVVNIFVYEGGVKVGDTLIQSGQVYQRTADGSFSLKPFDVTQGFRSASLFTKFIEAPSTSLIEATFTEKGILLTSPVPPVPDDPQPINDSVVSSSKFIDLIQPPPPAPPQPPEPKEPEPPTPHEKPPDKR
jgi:hypothetical protein